MPSSLTEEKLSAIYEKFWGRQTEYGLEIKSQDAAISKDELDKRIEAEFENANHIWISQITQGLLNILFSLSNIYVK